MSNETEIIVCNNEREYRGNPKTNMDGKMGFVSDKIKNRIS